MPNKRTGKPTLNERRKEQEKIDDYNESKKYRENLIIMLARMKDGEGVHKKTEEEKKQLDKQIGILKNSELLNKVFNQPVEKVELSDLRKAEELLSAIAEPNVKKDLQASGIDISKYTFK